MEFVPGFIVTIISLLIGYFLGRRDIDKNIEPDVKHKISQIFKKIIPNNEIGPVPVLSQRELDIIRNPKLKTEQDVMGNVLDKLNKK